METMSTQGVWGEASTQSINLFLLCILFLVVRMFLCALAAKGQEDGRFLLSDYKMGGLVLQSTDAGEFLPPYPRPCHSINWMLNRKKKKNPLHIPFTPRLHLCDILS